MYTKKNNKKKILIINKDQLSNKGKNKIRYINCKNFKNLITEK